ncbi:MAG: UDP-N-acetylmuramoyl-L-alanine--D-glutamate ligase [Treponema sp.]|nr:UDP-N-acetylmuramoyl-L-alanine--D-glutamate ligase [Treponema sp.]
MVFHTYSSECPFKSIADIKGKKITVMGLGLNGGGEAAVRFFLNKGALVTVTDMKTESQLKPTVDRLMNDKSLDTSRLTFRLGEHILSDFENADCVIKNPGVKYDGNKYLAAAKTIETDLSIFLRFTDCPIIAVTGSKGKSSTVSAIYYGLKQAGYNAFLGGNITVSPLSFFDEVNRDTPVVIEFSSWQLSDLRGRGVLKPYISIITKIVPDHQNWYGNMEDYVKDKRLIYKDQTKGDYSIFDAEDDESGTGPDKSLHPGATTWGNLFAEESKATVLRYGRQPLENTSATVVQDKKTYGVWQETKKDGTFCGKVLLGGMTEPEVILDGLSVPGEHMKINVLNAALVLYLMGVDAKRTREICKSWTGIDHRLQYFHSWKNINGKEIKFYNDSCATVPEAAAAASQSFDKSVILLTGGTDKGLELTPLKNVLCQKGNRDELNENGVIPVKDIYFLQGSATDKILPQLDKEGIKYHGPFESLDKMMTSLKEKLSETKTSEIIVFSPGATSFGMFSNEFDRGNQFMEKAKKFF